MHINISLFSSPSIFILLLVFSLSFTFFGNKISFDFQKLSAGLVFWFILNHHDCLSTEYAFRCILELIHPSMRFMIHLC
jgi:hypothetical protein